MKLARPCIALAFSWGGQHIAAATDTSVQVWATYTGEPVFHATGFSGAPHTLNWTHADEAVVLTTREGVWAWSASGGNLLSTYQPAKEVVNAAIAGTAPCMDGDRPALFAVTEGNSVLQLDLSDKAGPAVTVISELQNVQLGTVTALVASATTLFVGNNKGAISALPLPLGRGPATKSLRCGTGAVTCIATVPVSDGVLVGNADGSVLFAGSHLSSADTDVTSSEDERFTLIAAKELRTLRAKLRQFDIRLVDAIRERTAAQEAEVAALSAKLDLANTLAATQQGELAQMAAAAEAECAQRTAEHAQQLRASEQTFEQRLAIMDDAMVSKLREKADRCISLEQQLAAASEELNRQASTARAAAAADKEAAVQAVERQVAQEKRAREVAERDLLQAQAALHVERQQLNAAMEGKVKEAVAQAEAALAEERSMVQRLRGEAAVARHRAKDDQLAAIAAKETAAQHAADAAKLGALVEGQRHDLVGVKAELQRREAALLEKESILRDATARERALEGRCSAAEEGMAGARAQLEASKAETATLERLVTDLRAELKAAGQGKATAELAAEGRKLRENAARNEAAACRTALDAARRQIRHVQADIQAASATIHDPTELKAAVVRLYHAHAADTSAPGSPAGNAVKESEDGGPSEEEKLRAAVKRLRQQLQDQQEAAAEQKRRSMAENRKLMAEIHAMHNEVAALRRGAENKAERAAVHGGKGLGDATAVLTAHRNKL